MIVVKFGVFIFALSIMAFGGNTGTFSNPQPRIVYFGDSISWLTPGYASETCAALDCVRPSPQDAIPGSQLECAPILTVPCGEGTYATRVAPYAYDDLVIEYGVNDLWAMSTFPQYFNLDTWTTALDSVLSRADPTKTYVLSLPYITGNGLNPPAWSSGWGDAEQQMDAVTQRETLRFRATFIPLDMNASMIGSDSVHPNAAGMFWMGGKLLDALRSQTVQPAQRSVAPPAPPVTPPPATVPPLGQGGLPPTPVVAPMPVPRR